MSNLTCLDRNFFARRVQDVAPDLIGATFSCGKIGGIIVEVEAYHHTEAAAHSFGGRTTRNEVMFGPPGFAYVYRSYGIHWCFNVVCEPDGSASAVLVRALQPTVGINAMKLRRGISEERLLCSGPGRLCQALGITREHNGLAVNDSPFAIFGRTVEVDIVTGPRIGLTKAVDLPWRFGLAGSSYLSKPFRRPVP